MKVSLLFAISVAIVLGLLLFGISDSPTSTADTNIPNNEITSSVNQTDSPLSANATITIIMTTPPLPDE